MSQREQWRNDAVVLDLFEGGHWNPENTISWLRRQGPSVWHELARGFHWGNSGVGPLRAIVEFPNCDRATVMSIFALATPDYYEDELASGKKPEVMDEPDRFIVAILDAISDGFSSGLYMSARYRCIEDPEAWSDYYFKRQSEGKPCRWRLPRRAFEPTQGLHHEPAYVLQHDRFLIPFEQWRSCAA